MFCYQCEQTAKGQGCDKIGVCGKQPEVADLHDLLLYALQGLSLFAVEARRVGIIDKEANAFTCTSLFSTLTNVNFDQKYFLETIPRAVKIREKLKSKIEAAGGKTGFASPAAVFRPAGTIEGLLSQAAGVGLKADPEQNPDLLSLKHTLLFGIKGVAAYTDHARILGREDDVVYAFIHEALASLTRNDIPVNDRIALVLKCGEVNLRAMELLDAGNTGAYGHPVPTPVALGHKKGKAILISGHDLVDLEGLLKQSEGKSIYVYTHGEMLPTHGYPELKKYPHFYGHFGTAWQNQQKEFPNFPGAILMTTNCIQRPAAVYADNIFTSGCVGWPGATRIENRDFTARYCKGAGASRICGGCQRKDRDGGICKKYCNERCRQGD